MLPVRACMAVKIEAETEAEDIPFILNRVRDGMFFCSTRIVALVDPALAQNQPLLDALRAEGAELYFLKT